MIDVNLVTCCITGHRDQQIIYNVALIITTNVFQWFILVLLASS